MNPTSFVRAACCALALLATSCLPPSYQVGVRSQSPAARTAAFPETWGETGDATGSNRFVGKPEAGSGSVAVGARVMVTLVDGGLVEGEVVESVPGSYLLVRDVAGGSRKLLQGSIHSVRVVQ